MKLNSRYTDYFTEYSNYFGRVLRLLKSMYGMTNSRKLFSDELTQWLIEKGFIQSQFQMSIYYKYAPDGGKLLSYLMVMTAYIGIILKPLGKWFVDTIGNIFHVNLLVYAHWFMLIRISQMKDNSISVDQAICATSIIAKYLDTTTVK